MGLTHIRTPKNFVLEERLERYANAIETHPEGYRGRWAEACWPLDFAAATPAGAAKSAAGTCGRTTGNSPEQPAPVRSAAIGASNATTDQPRKFKAVHLDLGCGKGAFLTESAQRTPRELFIGMDIEPICIVYAAQRICEKNIPNALVLPRGAGSLKRIFAPGELASITLNFPTPYPKRRFAARRTTTVDNLLTYRDLLGTAGTLTLRTDSQPLRDYTLVQLDAAGYTVIWSSDDVRTEHPGFPETEYEQRLAAQGARVFGVQAIPGPEPAPTRIQRGRNAEQSLVAYLPDDLESLDYVPLGMEAAVTNLINRRRKRFS